MNVIFRLLCYNAGMSVNYEDATKDPERYQLLSNGAIYDHKVKHIMGNPGGGSTAINKANASALSKKRWADAAEDIQIGITRASGKPTIRLAVQEIGVQLWGVIENGQGRDKVAAAKTAMQLGDLAQDRRSIPNPHPIHQHALSSPRLSHQLLVGTSNSHSTLSFHGI